MTIVIDGSSLQTEYKSRGIGRYTRNLVDALSKLDSGHRIILTSRVEAIKDADLVHYPYFDLFHRHLPFLPGAAREVVTIHDLIPLRFPERYRMGARSGFNLWLQKHLVKRVQAVITDSAWSARDVQELLPVVGNRVSVVPLGVEKEFRVLPKTVVERVRRTHGLPETYTLYVGDVTVNKNVPTLIEAVSGIPDLHLVIVSKGMTNGGIPEVEAIRSAVEQFGVRSRVYFLNDVEFDPVDDLAGIYNGATVYVQPSLYEGFGLPVLEAMACGVPVVATRVASLPEVVGNAGVLCGTTGSELRGAIETVLKDEKFQDRLRERGLLRAKQFTWERTARMTLAVYESAFEQRSKLPSRGVLPLASPTATHGGDPGRGAPRARVTRSQVVPSTLREKLTRFSGDIS